MLQFDDYTLKIPARSFSRSHKSRYRFKGTINGQDIKAEFKGSRGRHSTKWTFEFEGKKVDVDDVDNSITVVLRVGNDHGEASIRGSIKKSKGGDDA